MWDSLIVLSVTSWQVLCGPSRTGGPSHRHRASAAWSPLAPPKWPPYPPPGSPLFDEAAAELGRLGGMKTADK